MLFFRSEEHVEAWCRAWKMEPGAILSIEQGWRLAQAWYSADRREPSWRRRTLDETEALFSDLGLTSGFWNLR
jgi:Alkylmercury lyase